MQIPAAGYGLCYLFEGCFFCWERVCLVFQNVDTLAAVDVSASKRPFVLGIP